MEEKEKKMTVFIRIGTLIQKTCKGKIKTIDDIFFNVAIIKKLINMYMKEEIGDVYLISNGSTNIEKQSFGGAILYAMEVIHSVSEAKVYHVHKCGHKQRDLDLQSIKGIIENDDLKPDECMIFADEVDKAGYNHETRDISNALGISYLNTYDKQQADSISEDEDKLYYYDD